MTYRPTAPRADYWLLIVVVVPFVTAVALALTRYEIHALAAAPFLLVPPLAVQLPSVRALDRSTRVVWIVVGCCVALAAAMLWSIPFALDQWAQECSQYDCF